MADFGGDETGVLNGIALSYAGFELVRVLPSGQVSIAEFAQRTAEQMIVSGNPEHMLVGHIARLIIAGHEKLQVNGHG